MGGQLVQYLQQGKIRTETDSIRLFKTIVPYNDIPSVEIFIGNDVAVVIVEPIQGEGGINIPNPDYLKNLSDLCTKNGVLLIMDEIQTEFDRTGSMFASDGVKIDILTMVKCIAGGFPFGAFAITEDINDKIEIRDHGGTYCGNPLGCAVAYSVIKYIIDNKILENIKEIGNFTIEQLNKLKKEYPDIIKDVRGKRLLIAIELLDNDTAAALYSECLNNGLILNVTQGNVMRIFPALNIFKEEMKKRLNIFEKALREYKKI